MHETFQSSIIITEDDVHLSNLGQVVTEAYGDGGDKESAQRSTTIQRTHTNPRILLLVHRANKTFSARLDRKNTLPRHHSSKNLTSEQRHQKHDDPCSPETDGRLDPGEDGEGDGGGHGSKTGSDASQPFDAVALDPIQHILGLCGPQVVR